MLYPTLESGIKVGISLLFFGFFPGGYALLKGATFINFLAFYFFDPFFYFFPLAMYTKFKISEGGYPYSKV